MSGRTITEAMVALRARPSPGRLVRAARSVVRQGRLLEVGYGVFSLLAHRPGRVMRQDVVQQDVVRQDGVRQDGAAAAFAAGWRHLRDTEEAVLANWLAGFPLVARWLGGVTLRLHTVARVGRHTVAAEYCEGDPRLFLLDEAGCRVSTHYRGMKGVRHLHCVLPVSAERFIVTTGDSLRAADLWRIEDGGLRFERRLLRFFGGFTAAATVSGRSYLGSDYSGRPNYLWRLDDGKRFFLPGACFRMFVDEMFVVGGRFIVVVCKRLDAAGGGRRPAVFDAVEECFVSESDSGGVVG